MQAGRRFRNWGRNQACVPAAVYRPTHSEAVAQIVREHAERSATLRVVGAGHSWSAAAMVDDNLGSLMQLDGLAPHFELAQDPTGTGTEATVSAGMRLHELGRRLDAEGLALPILGSVDAQTLAGATSTGTHGSSLHHGNLATGITGLELIDGHGERVWLERDDPRLAGARVGLGALGVLTRIRIRVRPAFRLQETLTRLPFDEGLAALEGLARQSAFLKVWWLPPSEDLIFFRYEPTDAPSTLGRVGPWLDDKLVNRYLFDWLLKFSARVPGIYAPVNRLINATRFGPATRVGRSDRMFTLAMPPRHRECEFAVDLGQAAAALHSMREIVHRLGTRVNFIQELRFVRGDDTWLSPAYGRDTAQLGAYMAPNPDLGPYFDAFAQRMHEMGARPHWGKELGTRIDAERVRALYPRADAFTALAHSFDPQRVFYNDFLRRILGP